ncbi:lysine transporter LysE [Mesorhizobium loti]|uniref:Lysine transporter LysE n=1 Tax=Rhizobium loti TaxID=381 RepID=A0A124GGT4_RHILI|nr:lysine transporter LysE [Mesorhizobium loti]
MEYIDSLAILIGVFILSLISPGPNFIIVTSTSMSVSRVAGLFAGLGLALASLTWALLTMAGLGLVIAHFEWLHTVIQVVGALYLIWLGVKMILGAGASIKVGAATAVRRRDAMRRAFIVSFTNPKSFAFYGSIFALVIPTRAPFWFYAVIAAVCFSLSMIWYCGLGLFFSNPLVARQFMKVKPALERVMGAALTLLGARLLWSR